MFIIILSSLFRMIQKTFSFTVRDSLINVGPLKDFSYGLRMNTDPNATGAAKQSNYELVSCLFLCHVNGMHDNCYHLYFFSIVTSNAYKSKLFLLISIIISEMFSGMLFWPWKEWLSVRASAVYSSRNHHPSM